MRTFPRVFLALAALLPGCASRDRPVRISASGATFVYPMMSTWAAEYEKAKGHQVNYQSIGSGGGIQQMTAKTVDFGCTDGPMSDAQLAKARAIGGDVIHVPLVMGAVVIAHDVPGVKEPLRFSGPLLADIFLGKVKKWNDPAIKGLNPGVDLPGLGIITVVRSDGSATTYIFVDYLAKVSAEWKKKVGVGTSVNWPEEANSIRHKGSEPAARLIKTTPGAIGYFELAYALQAEMPYGLVLNRAGRFVKPSLESVTAAADAALKDIPDDLRYSITDAPGEGSYPISGTRWAVLYTDRPAAEGGKVIDFLRWCLREGQGHCVQLHYARLPEGLARRALRKLDSITPGE